MAVINALSEQDIRSVLEKKNFKIFDDGRPNIVGLRTPNRTVNQFDDFCYVFSKDMPLQRHRITTDPGLTYMLNPIAGTKGCAILVPGQYVDAYQLGLHKQKQQALIQTGKPVKVYRDANKNNVLDMNPDSIEEGFFGINLHHAGISESQVIGGWSAGCQVWQNTIDHAKMISRFGTIAKIYNFKYFTYTLLVAADFQ